MPLCNFITMRIISILFIFIFINICGFQATSALNLQAQALCAESKSEKIMVSSEVQDRLETENTNLKTLIRQNNILIIVVVLLFIFIIGYIIAQIRLVRANHKLKEKNKEILEQKEEIEKQKDHITQKTMDLLVLNKELKENNELREGLTGMVVHDLKNPISNIIGMSESPEITFFAQSMLTMVENILDIQKYKGMIMPVHKETFFLRALVKKAIVQINLFAQRKNITIQNNVDKDLSVCADTDIVLRILANILTNAIKYTFSNGLVKIEANPSEEFPDKVKISVIDNGIGIKEDKIPLIFNKFNQIIAKDTGEARSTGIGLTFCKMAVEAHDSEIKVQSIPNKYTSFSFHLPYTPEKQKTEMTQDCKIVENRKISLNSEDKKYLRQFYEKLKKLEVYEIGELKKVIASIEEISEHVTLWKKEISSAIYNCNEQLYKKLLEQMS